MAVVSFTLACRRHPEREYLTGLVVGNGVAFCPDCGHGEHLASHIRVDGVAVAWGEAEPA